LQNQALKVLAFSIAIFTSIIFVVYILLDQNGTDTVNYFFESISGFMSGSITSLSMILPIGFAFGAGMIAAVNPCGFVMLPSYVAVYLLSEKDSPSGMTIRLIRALKVTISMTLGFVIVFGVIGSLVSFGLRSVIGSLLPWFGMGIGIALIAISGLLLFGFNQFRYSSLPFRLSSMFTIFQTDTIRGYFFFGVSYALVSVGCALPIFMVVVTSTFAGQSILGILMSYINYSLGMGTIIFVVTIITALLRKSLAFSGNLLGSFLNKATVVLLLVAGIYLVFYWLTMG
jgi:cytochrome c-type biogenesis protein